MLILNTFGAPRVPPEWACDMYLGSDHIDLSHPLHSFAMDCVGPQLKNSGGGGSSGGGAGAGPELESKETILSCRARLRQQKWI